MKRGRPKKYTAARLEKALEEYFDSITREIEVTEDVDSGRRDEKGHVVYTRVPVKNRRGETVKVVEYVIPPEVSGICRHLGIDCATWSRWSDDPELKDVVGRTREKLLAWNLHELITREGKNVRGIEANLRLNYGLSERKEIELGERAAKSLTAATVPLSEREAILREIALEFGGDELDADSEGDA